MRQRRFDRDEARQILIFRSQPVQRPRTHTRSHESAGSREGLKQGCAVIYALAHHRTDDGEVVGAITNVGKQITDRDAAFAAGFEIPERFHQRPHFSIGKSQRTFDRERFAMIAVQAFFRIKRINAGRPAVHKQKNHALSFCRKMGRVRSQRIDGLLRGVSLSFFRQHRHHAN